MAVLCVAVQLSPEIRPPSTPLPPRGLHKEDVGMPKQSEKVPPKCPVLVLCHCVCGLVFSEDTGKADVSVGGLSVFAMLITHLPSHYQASLPILPTLAMVMQRASGWNPFILTMTCLFLICPPNH